MPTVDAISLLRQDHRVIDALFKKFEGTSFRALKTKDTLVRKITTALLTHATIEEEVFYPFVRSLGDKLNDDILEALEEHHIVKSTLAELQDMAPSDERFAAKVTVLIENVRHHVKEEEHDVFPAVLKAAPPGALADLVPALDDARTHAPSRTRPSAPDMASGSDLGAMAAKSMETVTNRLGELRDLVGDAGAMVGDAAVKVGGAASQAFQRIRP